MLYWALVFLIVAIIAAIFGFGGVAVAAAGIAKLLFFRAGVTDFLKGRAGLLSSRENESRFRSGTFYASCRLHFSISFGLLPLCHVLS
jgi:uncharacterized membrane protein YtjA (UPF0391 family)